MHPCARLASVVCQRSAYRAYVAIDFQPELSSVPVSPKPKEPAPKST